MEQQFGGGNSGLFMIFRILPYLKYFLYIAIGLLVIAIVIWVIFAKKRARWAKVLAIILTILVIITGIPGAASFFFGMNMQQRGFQDREMPDGFERGGGQPPMKERNNINQSNEILDYTIIL